MSISVALESFFCFPVLCRKSGSNFFPSFWWNCILEPLLHFYLVKCGSKKHYNVSSLFSTIHAMGFPPLTLSSSFLTLPHIGRPVIHPVPLPTYQSAADNCFCPPLEEKRFRAQAYVLPLFLLHKQQLREAPRKGHGRLTLWLVFLAGALLFWTLKDPFCNFLTCYQALSLERNSIRGFVKIFCQSEK